MSGIWQDVRDALRTIRGSPASSLVIILTMALGIGGGSAIFSFVRGILLSPLPYPEASRLVMICETHPDMDADRCAASPGNLTDWKRMSGTVGAMGLARDWSFALLRDGKREGIRGGIATDGLFEVFGVRPERGRLFTREDSDPGRDLAAIVSYGFWESRLGGVAGAVGTRLRIDEETRTIVGILPPGFDAPGLRGVEVWIPLWSERREWRQWRGFRAYGRLAPGSTLDQARSEMESIRAAIEPISPETNRGWGIAVESLQERTVRSVRPALLVFLGAVGFVLLIACANIATILLARASTRGREFALRAALGARPRRLIRHLLMESLVLALLGAGLGLILGSWGTEALRALAPADIPRLAEVRMDAPVLIFSILLSVAASFLFGLAPAWHASRPSLDDVLKDGKRSGERRGSARTRHLLVVLEVAMAAMLLVGAGLLMRSFLHLLDWRPGFDRDHLLVTQIFSSSGKYPKADDVAALHLRAVDEVRSLPGVVAAAAGSAVPLHGGDGSQEFLIEGRPVPPAGQRPMVSWFDVGPGYFRTLGIPLLEGRVFTEADGPSSPSVAIINEAMARRFWPGGDPLGARVTLLLSRATLEIVGVVGNVSPFLPGRPAEPAIYWPYRQGPRWATMIAIRTASDPAAAAPAVRSRLQLVDPEMEIGRFVTMDDLVAGELVRPRFNMILVGLFALLALAIALVGVYGVISYSVERRAHEIGVRLAVGARRSDVLAMVLAGALKWTATGIALGLAGAAPLMFLMSRLLVDVGPRDPLTFAGVAILLTLVTLPACLLPAVRATRIDPVISLRTD